MNDIVRVLRILEYVGEREWVEETLKKGNVPASGIKVVNKTDCIKSALIDNFPEILNKENTKD